MKKEQFFMWLILLLVLQSLFIKSRRNKILASKLPIFGEGESMCNWIICSPILHLGLNPKSLPRAKNTEDPLEEDVVRVCRNSTIRTEKECQHLDGKWKWNNKDECWWCVDASADLI